MITGLYTGIFGLFLLYHIGSVIRLRFKHGVSLGDGGNADLNHAIRAHGNFIEMVPFFLIMMFLLEIQGMTILYLHVMGILMIVTRVLHDMGIKCPAAPQWPTRRLGSLLSLAIFAFGSLALIYISFK